MREAEIDHLRVPAKLFRNGNWAKTWTSISFFVFRMGCAFPYSRSYLYSECCMPHCLMHSHATFPHNIVRHSIVTHHMVTRAVFLLYLVLNTSSTAQGGGGSFNNRKPIREIGCCESGMAERSHWWTERWWTERCLISVSLSFFSFSLFLSVSLSFSDYLPTYLLIYLSTSLSACLSTYLSTYLSI